MQERRLRERIPFELKVEIHRSGNWVKIERSLDMSMSGIQLQSDVSLSVGEKVRLRLCLQEEESESSVEIEGEIVRVDAVDHHWLLGVCFENMTSDTSFFLYRLIQFHKS